MRALRYLARYQPGRVPWQPPFWYEWISNYCTNVCHLRFRPWYINPLPCFDIHKAWINGKKIRLAFTEKCHTPTPSKKALYSWVLIASDIKEYDGLLVLQYINGATHFIIETSRLLRQTHIALPVRIGSASQWERYRENWDFFRNAAAP